MPRTIAIPSSRRGGSLLRRINLRLVVIALVPAAGLATFASEETFGRQHAAEAADAVAAQAAVLADVVEVRFRLSQEQVPTMALTLAPAFGISIDDAEAMLGFDLSDQLDRTRAALDVILEDRQGDPTFVELQADVRRIRTGFQDGTLDAAGIFDAYNEVLGGLDERIERETEATYAVLPDERGVAEVGDAIDQLLEVHRLVTLGARQLPAFFADEIPGFEAVGTDSRPLDQVTAVYEEAVTHVADHVFGNAQMTWDRISADPRQVDFEAAIDDAIAAETQTFLTDLERSGLAVRNGLDRHALHYLFLDAARSDLEASTVRLRTEALSSLSNSIVLLFVVLVLSVMVVYYTGRSITRPLQRLAKRAAAVSNGELHTVQQIRVGGPLEVQTVAGAFQDVVSNLEAIDAQALALAAGRLDDPVLALPLPGRLGESLQASVALLSQSITDREELHRRLAHEATHDNLTGVPNRSAAMFTLEAAIARTKRRGESLAVLFVDIDDFKRTNDLLGHVVGDDVLRETSVRLLALARTEDTIARIGGDEFVVVAEGIGSIHDAVAIAERIVESIAAPMRLDGRVIRVSASVGVALTMDGDANGEQLIREANLAVYRAKEAGRNRVEVFDDTMRAEVGRRSVIEVELAEALRNDGLSVAYQPVVSSSTLRVEGFEALVRWRKADGTSVPPDAFIPIAEASDLIIELDRWVIRTAARELATWTSLGLDPSIHLAVNVSGRHLVDRRIVGDIAEALAHSGLEPTRLVLEITETVLLSDMPVACGHLEQLRALGVTIALDDFGSGYTSLATLRQLPVDVLKIDRSLVSELAPDKGQSLVRLIIEAAHEFGMGVIAEGVETDDQRQMLERLGCESVQGWLVSPAVPADKARELASISAG